MDNGYREYYQCIFPLGLYPVSSFNGFPRLFPGLCDLIPSDRNARLSFLILNDTQSPKPMNIILHCLSHNIPPSHPSIYPAAVSSTNPLAFVPHPFLLQLSHSSSLACFALLVLYRKINSGRVCWLEVEVEAQQQRSR